MEHEKDIYLYPFDGEWSDIGSWDSIAELYNNKNIEENVSGYSSQVSATTALKDRHFNQKCPKQHP